MSIIQLWEAHQSTFRTVYNANVYWDGVKLGSYKDVKSAHSAVMNCLYTNRHVKGKFLVGQSTDSFEGWLVTTWTCDIPSSQNTSSICGKKK